MRGSAARRCRCRCPTPAPAAAPGAAAADQHAAVVAVADGVADQVAQDALQQHRVGLRHVLRTPRNDSISPFSKAVGSKCRRSRPNSSRMRTGAGLTSTPPVSMRVMSSSSPNRPSSASTDSLMLLTRPPPRGRGCAGAAPRRTGPSRAAAGAGRGWRRQRTGSWRGWRLRRRGGRFRRRPSPRAAARPVRRCAPSARWPGPARCRRCAPSARDAEEMVSMPASCQCQGCWSSLATRRIIGSSTTLMKARKTRGCDDSSCTEAMQ
jgi:hypothetical protein